METDDAPKPGQTVAPTGSTPPPADPPTQSPQPDTPTTAPTTTEEPSSEPPEPQQEMTESPEDFAEDSGASPPETVRGSGPQTITWTASEFIAHAKSPSWYAMLGLATVAFAALVYLISRDFVSVGVILVAALLLGIYAGRQPRQLQYRLDNRGLSIGERQFGYSEFRSFSVLPEGAFSSIVFMPLKRFAMPTTIYYAPEDEDRIAGLISNYLPVERRGHDAVDRLMHHIRF